MEDAIQKLQKDYLALTRRVTARHILVPNEPVALAIKRKIRDECIHQNRFVVSVFEQAAQKYSLDNSTNQQGGLLGILVAPGHGYCCHQPIPMDLDRACFQVDLGALEGPLKTSLGYHLLLVTERINCPKLDGSNTKLIQLDDNDIFGTLVPSSSSSSSSSQSSLKVPSFDKPKSQQQHQIGQINILEVLLHQVGFWMIVFVAGGLLAEWLESHPV